MNTIAELQHEASLSVKVTRKDGTVEHHDAQPEQATWWQYMCSNCVGTWFEPGYQQRDLIFCPVCGHEERRR